MSRRSDPDEFSDSESNNGNEYEEENNLTAEQDQDQDQDQDEQHTQKVNGKIDSLKLKIKELESELKSEKKKHMKTKQSLSEISDKNRLNEETAQDILPVLIKELIPACLKLSIDDSLLQNETISINDVVNILKSIVNSKMKENTATRVNTSTSKTTTGGNDSLVARIKALEDELRLALGAAEDIKALKAKLLMMIDRLRSEKEARDRQNFELKASRKKISILTDHIEKLMNHLKHEAAAKIRALETLRDQEKITLNANQKCLKISKRAAAKDRLILELREGGKILEDQLRLMDEKYLELRTKLDFARDSSEKRIKKAEKLAGDLRVKFALAGNTKPLDSMPMPMQMSRSNTSPNEFGEATFSMSDAGDGFSFNQSYYTADTISKTSKKSDKSKKDRIVQPKEKVFESEEEKEAEVQRLLEKLRLKNGSSNNWTEEKARTLTL